MPKEVPQAELADIVKAVAVSPEPASLEEIAGKLTRPLARRTLQRRLARLVSEKRLAALGTGAGQRYRPASGLDMALPPSSATTDLNARIPLSDSAKETQRMVTRPAARRKPVGYDRSFLESYRPNVSAYLSPALRGKLAALGRTTG